MMEKNISEEEAKGALNEKEQPARELLKAVCAAYLCR